MARQAAVTMGQEPDGRRVVQWEPIACPYCGSREHVVYGRDRGGRVRYHLCTDCDRRFKSYEKEDT
jgi:transposase-like protein